MSRVNSSEVLRACASAIASPICWGVLPAHSTASPRPMRSRRWKSKVMSDMGAGPVKGTPHAIGLVAHRADLAMAREQPLDTHARGALPAQDPLQAVCVELDRDPLAQQPAANRMRPELVLDQALDRVHELQALGVTGMPVSSRLDRQGAAGSSARSSRPRLRASARTAVLSIRAST